MAGKRKGVIGERNGSAKLDKNAVRIIYNYLYYGKKDVKYILDRFKISRDTVRYIVTRKRWAHVTCDFPDFLKNLPRSLRCRGENHGRARLTNKQVRELRSPELKNKSSLQLAAQYNVSSSCIRKARSGISWVHLKEE